MAVFVFSGFIGDCDPLDRALEDALSNNPGDVIYIPSVPDGYQDEAQLLFATCTKDIARQVHIENLQKPLTTRQKSAIGRSALIFLGGGNTYFIMERIIKSGLAEVLTERVRKNRLVAGHSAGAIVLTPSIHTAGFPDFDRDENNVGLRRSKGLDALRFEFFPHYNNRPRYSRALRQFSRDRETLLLACPDNAGIVAYPDHVVFFGDVWGFWAGTRLRMSPLWKA